MMTDIKLNFTKWCSWLIALSCFFFYGCNEKKFKARLAVPFPKVTNTYKDLFPESAFKSIKPSFTFFNQKRPPTATFHSLDEHYTIIVYQTGLDASENLQKSIILNWTKNVDTGGEFYAGFSSGVLHFTEDTDLIKSASRLKINIDAVKTHNPVISDSLLYFGLRFKKASAYYGSHKDQDFVIKMPNSFLIEDVPVQFMFLKKDSLVYMLLACPIENDGDLPSNYLYNLMLDK